jgi:hypothetical protein
MTRARAVLAVLLLLAMPGGCGGGSDGPTTGDGPSASGCATVESRPGVCDLVVSPASVARGGSVTLDFGLADREGDVVALCVVLARLDSAGEPVPGEVWGACDSGEPLADGLLNERFTLELGPLVDDQGTPLPLGQYRVSLIFGDAAGHTSEEARAPLAIVSPLPDLVGRIVFEARRFDLTGDVYHQDLFLLDAETLQETRLTTWNGQDASPVFTPDGQGVVFVASNSSAELDLYRMGADGTERTRLTFASGDDLLADWR